LFYFVICSMLNSFCGLSSYLTGNTLSIHFILDVQLLLSLGVLTENQGTTPVTYKDFCVRIWTFTPFLVSVMGYTLSHACYMLCTFKPWSAHPHSI
jgi:hypothetical protein